MDLALVSQDAACTRLRCGGDVSQSQLMMKGDPLIGLLGPAAYKQSVLIDCTLTRFIDSSGLAWLLIAHKRFLEQGGRLVLHSVPPLVRQPIDLMRLDTILKIVGTEADAVALCGGASS